MIQVNDAGIIINRMGHPLDARKVCESYNDLLDAAELALKLIKDTWIESHGNEQVGIAWGKLHTAIAKATGE